jgi:ATP-dependent exoDNAse (exonuclease V) alpha subunit
MSEITLCDEQLDAVKRICESKHRSIILTGKAGSGKSEVIKHLTAKYPGKFRLTSTTGKSALLIGGTTLDKLFCFSRSNWKVFSESLLERNMRECPNYVIIDEASAIGARMASLISSIAARYDKQLILVGDWAQSSPVKDSWPVGTSLFDPEKTTLCRLLRCHRQHDLEYLNALNKVREGITDDSVHRVFQSRYCEGESITDKDTVLFAVNKLADEYNQYQLKEHAENSDEKLIRFTAAVLDSRSAASKASYPKTQEELERLIDESGCAHNEDLIVGVRVVITRNSPSKFTQSWVNGDTGTISCISTDESGDPSTVVITLDRTGDTVTIPKQDIESRNGAGNVDFIIRGFTVKLGYGLTVHKSQGMTTHKVFVDVGSFYSMPKSSLHGLMYVALSRTRTLEGLNLIGNWDPALVYSDPTVATML